MKRTIYPLYAPADEGKVRPILEALQNKGAALRHPGAKARREDALVLFLSENLAADGPEVDAFFRLNAGRALVIPVALDGSAPPEALQNALMARHALDGAKYAPEELADRIARAAAEGKRVRLPLILAAAAAMILLIVGSLIVLKNRKTGPGTVDLEPTPTPVPTAAPTAAPPLPDTGNITLEQLEKVHELIIVGDTLVYYTEEEGESWRWGIARVGLERVANRSFEDDQARWYSAEDGHEFSLHDWGDLSFLPYMKNLQVLTLVQVQGTIPEMSGVQRLNYIELYDCAISEISGLGGAFLYGFDYKGQVVDFSPLNSCQRLDTVSIEVYGSPDVDMSSFGPLELRELYLEGQGNERSISLDALKNCRKIERASFYRLPLTDLTCLSGSRVLSNLNLGDLPELTSLKGVEKRPLLSSVGIWGCGSLRDLSALSSCLLGELTIDGCPLSDLSFLSGATTLQRLQLYHMSSLRSFHGLEDHRTLRRVEAEYLPNLTDVSALSSCTNLEALIMHECFALADIHPAVQLPRLRDLQIYGSALSNVDFLWDIQNKEYFTFGIAEVNNWEGLAAIEKYSGLCITDRNGSALQYLQNATVTDFTLYNRSGRGNVSEGLDLTMLPHVTNELHLYCVRSLEGMDQPDLRRLILNDCPYLTSLSGVENAPKLVHLQVSDCPRLSDWSALYGRRLEEIELEALFTLPDFGQISVRDITLTTIYDLKDLSCFADYDREFYRISLMDVDGVTDLSPLYHVKGSYLWVPAHLKDQAQSMVDSGLLEGYEVSYPDGWWQPIVPNVELESLEEIDTLPSALAARIDRLFLVGNIIVPNEGAWVEEDYSADPPSFFIHLDDAEEPIRAEAGPLTDLSVLEKLTGLQELRIWAQPELTSLEGIQAMSDLRSLFIQQCPALTDGSALFTVQSLEQLLLRSTGVTSIQGIQNLYALRYLDLSGTPVEDLSPLGECSDALEEVNLHLPLMTAEELRALPEGVRRYIRTISLAGGYAFDDESWWFESDWITDPPRLYLRRSDTGELTSVSRETFMDLEELAALLPNLEGLGLYGQTLTSLDGIRDLSRLSWFSTDECRQIKDFSLLWTIPTLEDINIRNEPLASLEGIENLTRLTSLHISGTNVTDFSPLARADLSYCVSEERGGWGFNLALDVADANRLTYEDFAVLEAVPVYWSLNMNNVLTDRWLGHVMDKEMHQLSCRSTNISEAELRAFVDAHPDLEMLDLRDNPQLKDLSFLRGQAHLNQVYVSNYMTEAIASLGEGYSFDLNID